MDKELERSYKEILEYIEEEKPARARTSYKRQQLAFLRADVKRPQVPLNKGMRRLELKKQRRLENIKMKQTLGNFCRKLKK